MGRRYVGRDIVNHSIGMDIHVLAVAAPERRPGPNAGRSVPQSGARSGYIRLLAEAGIVRAAPLARAARHVLLQRDAVAFVDFPALLGAPADPCHDPNVLV